MEEIITSIRSVKTQLGILLTLLSHWLERLTKYVIVQVVLGYLTQASYK